MTISRTSAVLLLALSAVFVPPVKAQSNVLQPTLGARIVDTLHEDGFRFKDLNKNGTLDDYEDWRLPVAERVGSLLSQMTIDEKAGMMLINTLNAEAGGRLPDRAIEYIDEEKMTRFIFRNTVTATPQLSAGGRFGAGVTPYQAAQFMNAMQELAASTRLGIPVLFKSNARNHFTHDPRAGINVAAGSFSAWPKEAGLAATRDIELIAEFARTVAREWTAIGLRGMYGPVADLSTEPRWYRVHETFTEDADLAAKITATLVRNLQGEKLGPKSVALTIKHFPGGGPQEGGRDPHYEFGKNQTYPSDNFNYHLKPFEAAIRAGVSSAMPYYGIPIGQQYAPNDVGMAFSRGIVTTLLRDQLDFQGYVNSDTGIVNRMAWGLEDKSIDERLAIAIEAGTDVVSGFDEKEQILGLVRSSKLTEERVDQSVWRLLREQFELGLFENPYVDPNRADYVVGNRAFQRKAELAQRKSIVLLQHREVLLPIPAPKPEPRRGLQVPGAQRGSPRAGARKPLRVYTMGMNPEVVADETWSGFEVVSGDYDPEKDETRQAAPADTDYAIIRVFVRNGRGGGRFFGGADPAEVDLLAFSDMAKAKSWIVSPALEDIQAVMDEVGADKTILAINFRQPFVLDEASGLRNAGAILATFGVSDAAILDVLTGRFKPAGKLPFALAGSAKAVVEQDSDAPGYGADLLFPYGHGLSYE